MLDGNTKFSILSNNLFDIVSKLVIGIDLLFDKTVLFKIIIKHLPQMMLAY